MPERTSEIGALIEALDRAGAHCEVREAKRAERSRDERIAQVLRVEPGEDDTFSATTLFYFDQAGFLVCAGRPGDIDAQE